jgi:D-amino peptidase
MKILMGTDIEGVAGVVSFTDQSAREGRYYDAARRLLTGEINAAAEGLYEAGATDILVVDGHGPGAVYYEDLHPDLKLMHGRPMAPRSVQDPYRAAYDACVMIGQHAMAGVSTSNQNHTQSSRSIDYYKLNGALIGEIAQFALYHGDLAMPLIFLSGEQDACAEAEALVPGIATVSVKDGLSRNSAISLAAPQARSLIRAGIKKALAAHQTKPLAPLVVPGPYVLEKRFFFTHEADAAVSQPGAERVDSQTVRFRGDEIREIIYK